MKPSSIPSLLGDAMTLSKAMTEYLRYRASQGSPPGSVEQYERTYRSFLGYVQGEGKGDIPASFAYEAVAGWSQHEADRGVGPRTRDSRLYHLRSLAAWMLLLKDGRGRPLLTADPMENVENPKYKRRPQDFLYPAELKAFLAVPRPVAESAARDLFLDTMLRVTELLSANIGDVVGPDADGRYGLRVRLKGGDEKVVPLSPQVLEGITDYLLRRGPKQGAGYDARPLLVNRRGERWTRGALTQLIGRIAKQAGVTRIKVSAHKLRHTAASAALDGGVNPLAISKLLNHSSMRVTEQYLHLFPGALDTARDQQRAAMERYVNG